MRQLVNPVPLVYGGVRRLAGWLMFDRRQPVNTSRRIWLDSFGLDHPDRLEYGATSWTMLRSILPKNAVRSTDVFVDLGSGMGRVLQQAAKYPFARVIGVEISEDLNEIARVNFERHRGKFTCRNVDFVTCDATEYEFPDYVTHIYLYNPFTGETFSKVLNNIVSSIDRAPRRVTLMYLKPTMKEAVEQTGRFELVVVKRGVHIYQSAP